MKKFLIGLSIAFNIILVTFVIWVLSGGATGLAMIVAIERAHQRWISQFEILEVHPGDTVFLGDSITESGAWHELFPLSNVRNRGIGGDTTTGVMARLDQITRGRPGQIFLLIGANDLRLGTPSKDIVKNILDIVAQIHMTSPQTQVFVQSVLPSGEYYRESVEALNATLEVALEGLATWVDIYPLFLDQAGVSINDSLSNDELHLHGQGYQVWREAIAHMVD
jgi:lysophospholipase L1-like esterase